MHLHVKLNLKSAKSGVFVIHYRPEQICKMLGISYILGFSAVECFERLNETLAWDPENFIKFAPSAPGQVGVKS